MSKWAMSEWAMSEWAMSEWAMSEWANSQPCQKYYYLGPLEFFENEDFAAGAPRARAENLDFDF